MMKAAITSSKMMAGRISRMGVSSKTAVAKNKTQQMVLLCTAIRSAASFSSSAAPSLSSSDLWREGAYIDGKWISCSDYGKDKTFDVLDPATDHVIATLPDMGAEDATLAIAAAEKAFSDPDSPWKNLLAKERSSFLRDVFLLHKEHENELAEILALESGNVSVVSCTTPN